MWAASSIIPAPVMNHPTLGARAALLPLIPTILLCAPPSDASPPDGAASPGRGRILHPILESRLQPHLERGRAPFQAARPDGNVPVRVRTSDPPELRRAARKLGLAIRSVIGGIASVEAPAGALTALARVPGVISVKPARTYRPILDISTAEIGSDLAASAYAGTGRGVLVAVIDTGVDFRHPDFLQPDGSSRVLAAWDQSDPGGGGFNCGPGFTFGRCWRKPELDADLSGGAPAGLRDTYGHGTHVTGIAAGRDASGGPGAAYAGVAPEADLLIVRVFDDADNYVGDLPAAYAWIEQEAAAAGKPFAINISLGGDLGPHDGTDADEIAIDALLAPGIPGRAAAIAAGNSLNDGIHTEGTVTNGVSNVHPFDLPGYSPLDGADNDFLFLDIWHEGADAIVVSVRDAGGLLLASTGTGASSGLVCTPDGAILIDATNAPDPDNGDNEVFIIVSDDSACAGAPPPSPGGTLQVEVEGALISGSGAYHIWSEAYLGPFLAHIRFQPSVESTLVGSPATSLHATSVGAYVTRQCWPNADPNTADPTCFSLSAPIGEASGFSSNGPTRDGRMKPEIAAPGEWTASALASVLSSIPPSRRTPDGLHWTLRGTSMASPHAAGALAILLQLNPDLDAVQARSFLMEGARADAFTGAVPNMLYGAGKLGVAAAAAALLKLIDGVEIESGGALDWTAEVHSATYNVYRADLPGSLPASYGDCLASGLPAPGFTDTAIPVPGSAFAYLITGVRNGIEGSLGFDSATAQRPNVAPCP